MNSCEDLYEVSYTWPLVLLKKFDRLSLVCFGRAGTAEAVLLSALCAVISSFLAFEVDSSSARMVSNFDSKPLMNDPHLPAIVLISSANPKSIKVVLQDGSELLPLGIVHT